MNAEEPHGKARCGKSDPTSLDDVQSILGTCRHARKKHSRCRDDEFPTELRAKAPPSSPGTWFL